MKKHYIQDQFISELLNQSIRSVLLIAGMAGLVVAGLTIDSNTVIANFHDAVALLDSHV